MMDGRDFRKIEIIIEALRQHKAFQQLVEGATPFMIYRADTGAVLARNVYGYEDAKNRANEIRKRLGLKWSDVKFKADRTAQKKTYSNQYGKVEYASRYNPSKGKRFSGRYDRYGNWADLD